MRGAKVVHVCPRESLAFRRGQWYLLTPVLIDLSKCSDALLCGPPPLLYTGVDERTLFCLVGRGLLVLPGVVFLCKVVQ